MDRDARELSRILLHLDDLRTEMLFGSCDPMNDWTGADLPDGAAADLLIRSIGELQVAICDLRSCLRLLVEGAKE